MENHKESEGTNDKEGGSIEDMYRNMNQQFNRRDMVTESSPDMSKTDGVSGYIDGDDIPSSSLADSPISPQKRDINDPNLLQNLNMKAQ